MVAGAAEHELPAGYIEEVLTVKTKLDGDAKRRDDNCALVVAGTVDAAIARALGQEDSGHTPREVHRNRSRNFVEALGDLIRRQHHPSSGVLVFSKHYEKNQDEFGLNELLYEILVCETGTTKSPFKYRDLAYIKRAICAIESELSTNGRDALEDFNKLVPVHGEHRRSIRPYPWRSG